MDADRWFFDESENVNNDVESDEDDDKDFK